MSTPKVLLLVPGALCLSAVVVNTFMIVLMAKSRRLREDYVYKAIVSLSLCDLGSGVFVIGSSIVIALSGFDGADLHRGAMAQGCFIVFFGFSSTWHLAVVSLAKCVKVIFPLTHWTALSERRLCGLLAAVWAAAAGSGFVVPFFVDHRFSFYINVFLTYYGNSNIFMVNAVTGFVVPSIVIVAANLQLFLTVRKVQNLSIGFPGRSSNGDRANQPTGDYGQSLKRSIRSAKNILVICIVYWLLYAPVAVSIITHDLNDWYRFVTDWLYMANPFFNSFLYIVLHKSVRHEVRRLFFKSGRIHVDDVQHTEIERTE